MSERPYRVLFSGCRSQRTADQILAHLRAGHDVTVGLRPNGVEIERMEIDGVREVFELTEDDIAACRSFMPRFQLERGGNYQTIPLTEDQKSAILRKDQALAQLEVVRRMTPYLPWGNINDEN